jgi:WD40 repeat protein
LHWLDPDSLDDVRPSLTQIHDGLFLSFAMSPDRSRAASGSADGFVRIWDVATGRLDHQLSFAGMAVEGVAFVDDRRLGVVLSDGDFRVATVDTEELLEIVRKSVTRGFTDSECERFNFDPCPTMDQIRGE